MWLVAVDGYCLAGCEHYEGFCSVSITEPLRLIFELFFKFINSLMIARSVACNRVLSKADELRLRVFERKILRRIYGPICEGETWRSRYNEELYGLYDETDLVTTIRITRLRCAGHIVRMQDNLPCKQITLDKPEGRRRVGRPNLRWTDGVMRDVERLGVRNWRIKAKDRDGWRRLLESAKTLHGL